MGNVFPKPDQLEYEVTFIDNTGATRYIHHAAADSLLLVLADAKKAHEEYFGNSVGAPVVRLVIDIALPDPTYIRRAYLPPRRT